MILKVLLGLFVFILLYGSAIFGWTSWKLRVWDRIFAPWTAAIIRHDWPEVEKFVAKSHQHCNEYDDFCKRFAPFLLDGAKHDH